MAETPPNISSGAVLPPKKETGKVQPKKETVRINLPPKPSAAPTIKLPTLPPGGPTGAPTAIPAPTPAALLALVGKDVGMIYLGQIAGGKVSLALPSGQVVTAQGQLPYPEGSELLVRVLAGTGDAPVMQRTAAAAPAMSGLDQMLAIAAGVAGLFAAGTVIWLILIPTT